MDICGVDYGAFVAYRDTEKEAIDAALEECILGTPELVESAETCLKANEVACLESWECAYHATDITVSPCTISKCWPLEGDYYVTPQGLPGWKNLWRCDARVIIGGGYATCTMI